MKPKFNIWQWIERGERSNWQYVFTVKSPTEKEAIETAKMRLGLNGKFEAYPHIDNFERVA